MIYHEINRRRFLRQAAAGAAGAWGGTGLLTTPGRGDTAIDQPAALARSVDHDVTAALEPADAAVRGARCSISQPNIRPIEPHRMA